MEVDAGGIKRRRTGNPERTAPRPPSLACRPSPPQGGRSDVRSAFANHQRRRMCEDAGTANLPP
ncbi:MAG: hypothetical protein EOS78_17740 [Mesorhizobium sp.]|nr:MAG: hypothetical protein EOS78_17740 [Mesorhizobium sp.]